MDITLNIKYVNSGTCGEKQGIKYMRFSASINPGTLSGISFVYDTLIIDNIVADHEGVYHCEYNGGQDIFNLTVVVN